jgi:hypothetical protein
MGDPLNGYWKSMNFFHSASKKLILIINEQAKNKKIISNKKDYYFKFLNYV